MNSKPIKSLIHLLVFLGLSIIPLSPLFGQQKAPVVEDKEIHKILSMEISASINPATYDYLKAGFRKAEKTKTDLILIILNTPGGLVTTTKDILTLIGDSNIPVAIWIKPEGASATSAGALISSGAHILFMSDGTNIGAATPIEMSGDIKQKDMKSKAINDLVALVSGLANARGRNATHFSEMVEKAASFSSREAVKKNIIDKVVNTRKEFKESLEGMKITLKGKEYQLKVKNPEIVSFPMDMGQKLLNIFANPSFAYILFLIGAALIYLELQAPGGFIAGAIGAVCLVLAGIGFQVLPLNFGALGLMVLSFVLFMMEIYVTSYGILSLAGIGSLVAGSLFLFRTEEGTVHLSHSVIFSTVGAIVIFLLFCLFVILRDQKNIGQKKFNSLVGKSGTVLADLSVENEDYSYQIKVAGEVWKAYSKTPRKVGDHCEVIEQNDESIYLKI